MSSNFINSFDYRTNTKGEKIICGSTTKLKREEIRNWILENCVNQFGNIDLSYLDFSDFKGDIKIEGWLVNKDFYCLYSNIGGNLFVEGNIVREDLYNCCNTVGKDFVYGKDDIRGERKEYPFLEYDFITSHNKEEFLKKGFLKDCVNSENVKLNIDDYILNALKEDYKIKH